MESSELGLWERGRMRALPSSVDSSMEIWGGKGHWEVVGTEVFLEEVGFSDYALERFVLSLPPLLPPRLR